MWISQQTYYEAKIWRAQHHEQDDKVDDSGNDDDNDDGCRIFVTINNIKTYKC